MIQDVTLHGKIAPNVECHVTVAGGDVAHRYFYEHHDNGDGASLRFFASGFEFAFMPNGIHYQGPGGSIGEYMFGTDQPVEDLIKKDVLNRLVMFGAYDAPEKAPLRFSNRVEGFENYRYVFLEGNAVANYYFLIPTPFEGEARARQANILRRLGKVLKRTPLVPAQDDVALAHLIADSLGEPETVIYLFRVVNTAHRRYQEAFREIYRTHAQPSDEELRMLEDLASEFGIEPYQQQRIRMDVIYKHPENQKLVETYKDVLISCSEGGLTDTNRVRLQRLRTLSLRHNVPSSLLDLLDELLLGETFRHERAGSSDDVQRTREILESLFLGGQETQAGISPHDVKEILLAKRRASDDRDNMFEQVLLDAGRACDEAAASTGNLAPLEQFGNIITYLDRYDSTASNINRLAFMEDAALLGDKIRSLLGNKKEFDELSPGFFEEMFVAPIARNKYIPRYGRAKVLALLDGLKRIEEGAASLGDVERALRDIVHEDRLYRAVHGAIKERIRSFYYSDLRDRDAVERLRREIALELRQRGALAEGEDIPERFFSSVVLDLQKEAFYVQQVLPEVIDKRDTAMREDFLVNSGLDRFYVEDLETEYMRAAEMDESILASVREAAL